MEDVDEPRCQAGADTQILQTLETLGFAWDGPVIYQSWRKERYREVLDLLKAKGFAYPCACSRKDLMNAPTAVDGSPRYPGTCRNGLPPGTAARAWRLRVNDDPVGFEDAVQGVRSQRLERDVGDFVLLRADGYFAYQLAVVVDDADQDITHVVRGADLLDSTPRQIYLQRLLGLPVPAYTHLPVAVNAAGEKLSKQTKAEAVDESRPVASLAAAWRFLGQDHAHDLEQATVTEFWRHALATWNPALIPRERSSPSLLDSGAA
jgi:glutamyl-Q tRNA(Asp) synthetase